MKRHLLALLLPAAMALAGCPARQAAPRPGFLAAPADGWPFVFEIGGDEDDDPLVDVVEEGEDEGEVDLSILEDIQGGGPGEGEAPPEGEDAPKAED